MMLWGLWENFVTGMLDISIQAAVIFCVLLLVRAVFSLCRVPKKYVCFLWLILFVRLLMPVQPESPVGLWIKGSTQPSPVENLRSYFHNSAAVGEKISAPEEVYGAESVNKPEEQRESEGIYMPEGLYQTGNVYTLVELHGPEEIRPILCVVWGAGCLGFLLYGGISFLLLRQKLQCCIKKEENCYLADGIPTAFVMGVFRPRIYLPSELGAEDLAYVVLHERIHIKRKDYLIKTAAYLITCFYWFHPFVWAALIFLGRDIELSCDEAVLSKLGEGSRQGYADTLLRLSVGRYYFAGVPIAFGEGDMESRIKHIIRYRKSAMTVAVLAVILIVVLTVSLLTGRPAVEESGRGNDNSAGQLLGDSRETSEPDPANGNQPSGGQENGPQIAGQEGNQADASGIAGREGGQTDASGIADQEGNQADASGIAGREGSQTVASGIVDQTVGSAGNQSLIYDTVELPSGHVVALSDKSVVTIDGESYDMAELCEFVNGIFREVRELDKYIVIDGHISPDNSYFGFFNTENGQWEWGFIGSLLTWDENWEKLDNPVESVIYAESGDSQGVIRDWKGNMIAIFDLDHEFVYGLKRVGDDITITIINEAVEKRELSFDFKDSFHTLYHW